MIDDLSVTKDGSVVSYAMDLKFRSQAAPRNVVAVVGCGGTGARVFPALIKMLHPEDVVFAIDHDIVEARNVARQHFSRLDIGKYKAQVMEERYHSPDGEGPQVMALTRKVDDQHDISNLLMGAMNDFRSTVVILGCVDNIEARMMMRDIAEYLRASRIRHVYLDAGNETRTGQVLLASAARYQLTADSFLLTNPGMRKVSVADRMVHLKGTGAFPDLFPPRDVKPEASANPDAGEGCAHRIDLQTVTVNQLAATAMCNLLMPFIYPGVSLRNMGVTFSTYNTMGPVLPKTVDAAGSLHPVEIQC